MKTENKEKKAILDVVREIANAGQGRPKGNFKPASVAYFQQYVKNTAGKAYPAGREPDTDIIAMLWAQDEQVKAHRDSVRDTEQVTRKATKAVSKMSQEQLEAWAKENGLALVAAI